MADTIKLTHGHEHILEIATANNRHAKDWKNKEVTWGKFLNRISETQRTHETVAAYKAMHKPEQDQIKDVGGFVAGSLKEGRRKNGYVLTRSIITLDADFAPQDLWDEIELLTPYAAACYSTHKHTPEKPRLRVLIPLSRSVSADEYEAIARKIAEQIGIDHFDDTTYEPARLMYWPSTSKDGEYFFKYIDAPLLNPDEILALYSNWTDASFWPVSSRSEGQRKKTASKQGDPLAKDGLIGAFCRTYSIHDVIDTFLSDIYESTEHPDRYTFKGGSTSAGLVVYDDKFAFSNHGTDPSSGMLCNAFDLVRIHKFADLDLEQKEDTPVNRMKSWTAMMNLIQTDEKTKLTIGKEHLAGALEDFSGDELPEDMDTDWLAKLETQRNGEYKSTIDNFYTIMMNDPNLKGIGGRNIFTDKNEVHHELPWERIGATWTDIDDAGLRHYIEKVYKVEGRQKITDALVLVFEENSYHPVKDYLGSLTWDRTPRLESVFIDYLGSTDSRYTRTLTRKTMVAAVKRIYEPGCKFDYMLTLVGKQGIGKSYIISKLGNGWSSDTLVDIHGKEAYEALDGVWLMEMGELAALKKSEREAVKNYISKQEDTYRKAYARNISVNKRQCIFIGTTNDEEFLSDSTGGRRFWILDTDENKRTKTVWDDMDQDTVDQIWAEAMHYYKAGENIMSLPADILQVAVAVQEKHSQANEFYGSIEEYLKKSIPMNWKAMSIQERRQWLNASEEFQDENKEPRMLRNQISPVEIWVECLLGEAKNLTRSISRTINDAMDKMPGWTKDQYPKRYGPYGNQRGYYKILEIQVEDEF